MLIQSIADVMENGSPETYTYLECDCGKTWSDDPFFNTWPGYPYGITLKNCPECGKATQINE